MKRTLTIILLSILTLALLLCGCDKNSKKEDEIIKKTEIRQDAGSVIVVYEDGYERTYSLTQPIDVLVEKDGSRSARAIGSSIFYLTLRDGVTITTDKAVAGTGGYYAEGDGLGNYTVSGEGFIGTASGVQVQNGANYFEHDGKKYEDCSAELFTIFRANTTMVDFATGYEKEPFDSISNSGFTRFEKLESVILPTSIKKVGKKAFDECNKLITVYYCGTAAEWKSVELVSTEIKHKDDKDDKNEPVEIIENALAKCTVYFYSEQAPTGTGNYWHLVDGKPTKW